MTARCCLDCGTPEVRAEKGCIGGYVTNLEPTSGLCLPCLSKAARRQREAEKALPFDYKAAQAGKDE